MSVRDEHLPGPWFVGCMENECDGSIFGPLWTYEHAVRESEQRYTVWDDLHPDPRAQCPYAHLIGRTVGDNVEPRVPPLYYETGFGDEFEAAWKWLDDRRGRLLGVAA